MKVKIQKEKNTQKDTEKSELQNFIYYGGISITAVSIALCIFAGLIGGFTITLN